MSIRQKEVQVKVVLGARRTDQTQSLLSTSSEFPPLKVVSEVHKCYSVMLLNERSLSSVSPETLTA